MAVLTKISTLRPGYGIVNGTVTEGLGALCLSRVLNPKKRYSKGGANYAALVYEDDTVGTYWRLKNFRIGIDGQANLVNEVKRVADVWGGGPDGHVGGFVDVELTGLGGDFALADGVWTLPLKVGQPLGEGPQYTFMWWAAYLPDISDLWLHVRWYHFLTQYKVFVGNRAEDPYLNHCWKSWSKGAGSIDDPEGSYSEDSCDASACADGESCALSGGATCRIRWAGATWL